MLEQQINPRFAAAFDKRRGEEKITMTLTHLGANEGAGLQLQARPVNACADGWRQLILEEGWR